MRDLLALKNRLEPHRVLVLLIVGVLLLSTIPAVAQATAARTGHDKRVSSQSSASTPRAATANVVEFNRIDLGNSASLENRSDDDRYQVMVLQATEANEIPALKAANPDLKILLYQDPMLARPSDPTGLTVCSTYPSLSGTDPDWMLHDQDGNTIPDKDEPGNYLMDVGNLQYQHSCVAHAIALAKSEGADGVMWDDVNASVNWYVPDGDRVPAYTHSSSWIDAETSFLTYATSQLHDSDLISFANLGGASTVSGLWAKWSSLVDGSMEQSWNDWTAGGARGVDADFAQLLREPAWSEAHHKYTILEADDNGKAENTFGLASMMLAADGWTSYSTANLNQTCDEQWYPSYAAAQKLGVPLGRYVKLRDGLYERRFSHGLVLVNPSRRHVDVHLSSRMMNTATGRPVQRQLRVGANVADILQTS